MADQYIEPPDHIKSNPVEQRYWKIMTYGGCSREESVILSDRYKADLRGAINEARAKIGKKPFTKEQFS